MLRKLTAVRGLVNSSLRARVWPLLLGLVRNDVQRAEYEAQAVGDHNDVQTIKNDVARSLHSYTEGAFILFLPRLETSIVKGECTLSSWIPPSRRCI